MAKGDSRVPMGSRRPEIGPARLAVACVLCVLAASLATMVPPFAPFSTQEGEASASAGTRPAGMLPMEAFLAYADDGTPAGPPEEVPLAEDAVRLEVPWRFGTDGDGATYLRTAVLLRDDGTWNVVSDYSVLEGLDLLTEAEADAQDIAAGRRPYETFQETWDRERDFPVGQYETQQKAELIVAAALYLEREYGVGQGLPHHYRLAVLPVGSLGGGAVDVEWYLADQYMGTTYLRFDNATVDSCREPRGYDPR